MAAARILDPVDAVPEAHDALLRGELGVEIVGDVVGAADLVEHVLDALVGAAMQGALQGADG